MDVYRDKSSFMAYEGSHVDFHVGSRGKMREYPYGISRVPPESQVESPWDLAGARGHRLGNPRGPVESHVGAQKVRRGSPLQTMGAKGSSHRRPPQTTIECTVYYCKTRGCEPCRRLHWTGTRRHGGYAHTSFTGIVSFCFKARSLWFP